MWVVKLGGSLNDNPLLAQWLELLVEIGGGRVALVCGGGRFADEVRRAQNHWRFDDLAAHNMAVLAMAQTTWMALGLQPGLRLAHNEDEIRRVLHRGHTALWMPLDHVRTEPDADTNWDHASDSIALDLARKLSAERLVVVKSCPIDPAASETCLSAYRRTGWTSLAPDNCRGATLILPRDGAWTLWGWPYRFLDRMAGAGEERNSSTG